MDISKSTPNNLAPRPHTYEVQEEEEEKERKKKIGCHSSNNGESKIKSR